jgi:predicted DsbA family dithiol-disulfide isomerase
MNDNSDGKIEFDIFYDYLCPNAHAVTVWVRQLHELLGDRLTVNWRYFPLEQANSTHGPEWKLWEQPADYQSPGLNAFHAAIAAGNQGKEAFERFHYALIDARHVTGRNVSRRPTLRALAEQVGLDLAQFDRDMEDRSLLKQLRDDYNAARNEHGVFGTPTLVFPSGEAVYLKMRPAPPAKDAVAVLEEILQIARRRPYIAEIKRPDRLAA